MNAPATFPAPQFGSLSRSRYDEAVLKNDVLARIAELMRSLENAGDKSEVMERPLKDFREAFVDLVHDHCLTESFWQRQIGEML